MKNQLDFSLPKSAKIVIRSAATGALVRIKTRALTEAEKRRLSSAFAFIKSRFDDSEDSRDLNLAVLTAMTITRFVPTPSKHLGAYTGWLDNKIPVVFLNVKQFKERLVPLEEFAVTILHELLHVLEHDTASDDAKHPTSLDEAKHDLCTYGLLGLGIPADHWAFRKYPELLELTEEASAESA